MLSEEQIEAYRKMTVEERWREVEALMDLAWRYLKELPHEELERRLAYDRQQHDEADARVLEHLRRFQ
jgi:vacuolar-type H+-ATPase subunit B/Vma2